MERAAPLVALSPAATSPGLVDTLTARGLVERTRGADARVHAVAVTPAGRQTVEAGRRQADQVVRRCWSTGCRTPT